KKFLLLSRAIAHVESANFPVAYCGLKIITSLSLRFPDFQRKHSDSINLESKPRMADMIKFVTACEVDVGLQGELIKALH
ncbi:MAG: hypothetical protein V3U87_11450, partial [Methylococcaceae bacterium]